MPRNYIIYENTIIYKIVCKNLNIKELYVGSTTNFKHRKRSHKEACTNDLHPSYLQQKYVVMRANEGWENWEMIEIEKFPCADSNEARARERYWCETLNSSMNTRKPLRTLDEKEAYDKIWFQLNKDILKDKRIEKYNKIKDDVEFRKSNVQRVNEYRQKNHDAILTRQRANITVCQCGSSHRSTDRSQHLKSKKHNDFINRI